MKSKENHSNKIDTSEKAALDYIIVLGFSVSFRELVVVLLSSLLDLSAVFSVV